MLWLKGCPRCNGDLCEEKDMYGPYIDCLQCGHYLSEAEEVALRWYTLGELATRSQKVDEKAMVTAGKAA